jgi:hypothetical protein
MVVLRLTESAWLAGSEEVEKASKLPIPKRVPDPHGTLTSVSFDPRHDLDSATEELAKELGALRASSRRPKGPTPLNLA